jgi:hypothetical protein
MVVDIVVYSLILPSSVFGLVQEESGAKLVMRDYLLQANSSKRTIVPEQGGVAKEETSFLFTTRGERPLELDYAQNLWDGCFRGGYGESCSPVDPSRTPRVPLLSWEQYRHRRTDARDCASE